jgi:biopolymer transport protein ExbB/TolQ
MNRLLTTIVQLAIAIPALYCARLVWHEIKADMREMWHESHS